MIKETTFYIVLNIKTGNGFENFGKFFLGNNRDAAYSIFQKLKGSKKINEKTILHLDFMETKKGLPLNIQVISCSLEELAENCKIITKETFKLLNLGET
jgi:hypothetical protein